MSKKYIIPLMLVIFTSGLVSLMAQDDFTKEDGTKLFAKSQGLFKEKKYEEAITGYKKIYEHFPKTKMGANVAYNIACGYGLLNKNSDALEWLEKAIDSGFTTSALIRQDEDLANVRKEAKFAKLLEKIESPMAEDGFDIEGGGKASDFEVDDIYGKTHKLSDYKGKVFIIQHMHPGCDICNKLILDTMELREKYGKENLKAILFSFDGTFNDDSDRVKKRDLIKNLVENRKPTIAGQYIPKMDYDAYFVWSYKTYVPQLGSLRFKEEPILTCIIDKDGNFVYRKTQRAASKEKMDKYLSKMLTPVQGK